jgi:PAS domain S-box-containing protein
MALPPPTSSDPALVHTGPLLQASGAQLAAMIASAMDGVITIDHAQRIVLFNQAAERMFRCTAADVLGAPLDRLLPERFRTGHARLVRAFGETGETSRRMGALSRPLTGLRADGEEFPIEASISHTEEGGQPLYTVILRDVAERVLAERQLQEQRETLAAVIDAASDAIVSTDEQGLISLFNPAAVRIFGHSAETMLGQPLETLLPVHLRSGHLQAVQGFARSRVTRRAMGAGRVKGLNARGEELELEASISHAMVNGRRTLTAILRDVTQRVRAETELLRYQVELSQLAQQLMSQEKTTTRRLAQSLHDQLGQTLTAIRLQFDVHMAAAARASAGASATASEGPSAAPATERETRLSALIDEAIREVRQVLVDLRPPLLDDNGLAAALDNELRTREAALPGLDLLLETEPELAAQRWPSDVEYAAFMVAREAVGNAIRHADASLVRVLLSGGATSLVLEVIDDGRGISAGEQRSRPGHLGMVGMRERALAIGAQFEVRALAEGGTSARLEWRGNVP